MATEEHKHLANIIKSTHATLREEAQNYGPEIAWQRHVTRKSLLQDYAASMQKLATTYWAENNLSSNDRTLCRMEWIRSQCKDYFFRGGREKYDRREEEINVKIKMSNEQTKGHPCSDPINKVVDLECTANKSPLAGKIKMLDVGSCYNPFGTEDEFDVTAIDLTAVPDKVLQCDFLNVNVGKEKVFSSDHEVVQLTESSFDVVVFSLFLEYLPCPEQRYLCCKKAYDLLQNRGILVVVSPDSKHVNANAKIMKLWRYILSKLGFMRIKYEKLRHIHCMVFRKCTIKDVALRWANLQVLPDDQLYRTFNRIYIPQDFRNTLKEDEDEVQEKYSTDELKSVFSELPFDSS